ncbi:MAG: TAT-variant-translocated molybdopterin oxidoreductase [Phycisphaerales bacterium]
MSQIDQCPSTTGKKDASKARPKHSERTPHSLVGASGSGRAYWRSVDDALDTPEFREWLEREFPAGASELMKGSRRTFMKIMGASVALAGAATIPGCRRPEHTIMPYSQRVPEETIPGKSLYFASSFPLPGGGAEGILVESHEGRPTKIEGNPLHPINRGRSSLWAQASLLQMYDPDRLTDPVFTDVDGSARSWDDVRAWSKQHFAKYESNGGRGLAFIADRKTSPTRDAVRSRLLKKWPEAKWVSYDPLQSDDAVRGSAMAFGKPMREIYALDKASVIVALDRDFMHHEPMSLVYARQYTAGRRALTTKDSMNRLYAIESAFSITGGKADHRLQLAPSVIPAAVVMLAKEVLAKDGVKKSNALGQAVANIGTPQGLTIDAKVEKWIKALADDLTGGNLGKSAVMPGASLPAPVQALVHALNDALGNVGKTVSYLAMSEEEAASSVAGIREVAEGINARTIDTVVCLNVNPVYDAPAELNFAEVFKKAPMRMTLSVDMNETVAASNWRLNGAHFLEAWGDTEAYDGTIAPIQPLIAPLYNGKSDIELLAMMMGEEQWKGYDLVRATWEKKAGAEGFEKKWRRALHDGVLAGTSGAAADAGSDIGTKAAMALAGFGLSTGPNSSAMDVVFTVGHVGDGRLANVAWVQEIPDPVSKIVWDNVAYVSPKTAKELGIVQQKETVKKRGARMVTVTIGEQSMDIAAWAVPGVADNTIVLPLGYGRDVCGRVGRGVGFNTYRIRGSASRRVASGARLATTTAGSKWYNISTTQQHGAMEGRSLVREVDLAAWAKHGDEVARPTDPYGNEKTLNFAEQLGDLAHAPANVSIYKNPFNQSKDGAAPGSAYSKGPQWGMTIDLTTCIGCDVCTIACQAENNIPVVGKIEVNKHREMHWIRVDRYFVSDANRGAESADPSDAALSMSFQPVACVHCENAPCETVCPVNATVHGPEGINYMTYNRCIGTRYCANNCPYKVRRFNFFDFGVAKFNGDHKLEEVLPGGGPKNVNLIPPRLRARLDEITKMQMNPNVTVRSRGVMEKCSYCMQRINEARIEMKLSDLKVAGSGPTPPIPDGFFQAACQQACPTGAITFGDILDTQTEYDDPLFPGGKRRGSLVYNMREHGRSYMLLGFLNTRPRTTHMVSVLNPNPAIRSPIADPFEHGHDHDHDGHGHTMNGRGVGDGWNEDKGHKLSLAVLGAGRGVHA